MGVLRRYNWIPVSGNRPRNEKDGMGGLLRWPEGSGPDNTSPMPRTCYHRGLGSLRIATAVPVNAADATSGSVK